jgi:hypothetical protein
MLDLLISPFARIIGVIVLIGALFGFGYYKGYSGEKQRFDTYKADIEAQVKAQEAINEATKKQQDIIGKSIRSDYENKLSALKHYYNGVRQQSSTSLSTLPSSSISINAETPNLELACSSTTQQLISLQEWIVEVSKTGR